MLTGKPSLATARVALSSGSGELAYNICESLLAERQTDSRLLVCRGDALAAMGRNAEAISSYEAALASDSKSAAAKVGLGRVSLVIDPVRAEAMFLDALTSDPRNAIALNNLGIARDLQGRHAEAQTAYAEAIASAPDMRAPQVNLALSYAMTGRAGEALRIMRPIGTRADATQKERHDLAAILAMNGKSDEASRLLRPELSGAETDEAVSGFQALPRSQGYGAPLPQASRAKASAAPDSKAAAAAAAQVAPAVQFVPDQAPSGVPIVLRPPSTGLVAVPAGPPIVLMAPAVVPAPEAPAAAVAQPIVLAPPVVAPVAQPVTLSPPDAGPEARPIVLQPQPEEPAPADPVKPKRKPQKLIPS